MSNYLDRAKKELELAGAFDKKSMYGTMLGEAVMELMEVFDKQGHSGMSASLVTNMFKRVANFEILTPLTGDDDEWKPIDPMFDKKSQQNKRLPSVFRDIKTGKSEFIEAIVFQDEDGMTFTGNCCDRNLNYVASSAFIKEFPFMPKKFYIDVYRYEIVGGDVDYILKDMSQLKEAEEYYDLKITHP